MEVIAEDLNQPDLSIKSFSTAVRVAGKIYQIIIKYIK